jgi:hypothetical protein
MGTQLCTHTHNNAYAYKQLLAGTTSIMLRCSISVVALPHHVRWKQIKALATRLRALICNELYLSDTALKC